MATAESVATLNGGDILHKLSEKDIAAIESALNKGLRVEIIRQEDGSILFQTVQRKRLKT